MAKKQPQPEDPAQPDHTPALMRAITTDAHAGQGGSYIFDPVTGTRAPRIDEAAAAAHPQSAQES